MPAVVLGLVCRRVALAVGGEVVSRKVTGGGTRGLEVGQLGRGGQQVAVLMLRKSSGKSYRINGGVFLTH